MNAAAKLAIVPDDAAVLLNLLAPGEPVTFQTFDDKHKPKDPRLTSILHGTLAQHRAKLAALNARGAGIFWMVNAGDGKGREARNVQRIRALFVDLDGAPLEPVQSAPLAPHAIVESSRNRWHAYWRVSDCPLPDFKPMQKALAARFHSDASVCGLPNVLRLPGFVHQKAADDNGHDGKPFQSRIFQLCEAPPYSLAAFRDAFAADLDPPATQETQETQVTQVSQVTQVTQVRGGEDGGPKLSIARFVPTNAGQRNRCLFALVRHVKARMPNATRTEQRDIVTQWHALASPVMGTADFAESWGDFARGWDNVRFAEGAMMTKLLENVDADPLPDGLPDDYDPRTLRLVRICGRLQREAGNEPFFLSARTAADLLDVHCTRAHSRLSALVADGVLDRVTCGMLKDRQASEYRMRAAVQDSGDAP